MSLWGPLLLHRDSATPIASSAHDSDDCGCNAGNGKSCSCQALKQVVKTVWRGSFVERARFQRVLGSHLEQGLVGRRGGAIQTVRGRAQDSGRQVLEQALCVA